jgi:hypothetical protein
MAEKKWNVNLLKGKKIDWFVHKVIMIFFSIKILRAIILALAMEFLEI